MWTKQKQKRKKKKEKRVPGPRLTKPSRGGPWAALPPHAAISGVQELPFLRATERASACGTWPVRPSHAHAVGPSPASTARVASERG
jgi:hypothetical protein